ncbi:MAG: hypothetical protein JKY95_12330 [Planctomycetaceae bacterium]|nr:hypothetical protein [Planctomycetaceae bacterium]
MNRFLSALLCALVLMGTSLGNAADKKEPAIKALLITGGCCHDYERQKLIITKGISARLWLAFLL